MVILAPGGVAGAGYVDDISYKAQNFGEHEYEILLQRGSEFVIMEAQKFDQKTIIVVRWEPGG